MKVFLFNIASFASALSTGQMRPCDMAVEECSLNFDCVDFPYCSEDGFYFTGPVCSIEGSCSCIDRLTGAKSVSSEGVELTTQVYLPADFFGSWMTDAQFSCDLFSSDASESASLAETVPEYVLSQIAL
ncbi:Oidioi.mRNA.OKI2018_I69.PAR.g11072.t1.cds [Oikopleura dioica]|uniref:Oidioi.mRNA.OKI2018_I69.PAR.g11072.t1.cds n=1 Tax=Oikopleura dioica TaxID=34765 RepID=A0ABN7RX62_OIKDI|nr:Oidioi.mRNA.OKI2018_I69.PAR.g11072.t1.cds [Oikopleura dioica]